MNEQQEQHRNNLHQRQEAHTSECLVYRLHSVSQIAHLEGEDQLENLGAFTAQTVDSLRSPTT